MPALICYDRMVRRETPRAHSAHPWQRGAEASSESPDGELLIFARLEGLRKAIALRLACLLTRATTVCNCEGHLRSVPRVNRDELASRCEQRAPLPRKRRPQLAASVGARSQAGAFACKHITRTQAHGAKHLRPKCNVITTVRTDFLRLAPRAARRRAHPSNDASRFSTACQRSRNRPESSERVRIPASQAPVLVGRYRGLRCVASDRACDPFVRGCHQTRPFTSYRGD